MNEPLYIYAIGFLAQILFSARTLLQWWKSEKARSVVSPSSYWVLSIAASYLLCIYGWFREDFSIIFGQFISYYIYIWNLKSKGVWKHLNTVFKVVLFSTPIAALLWGLRDISAIADIFFFNEEISLPLLIFGSAGQIIFTLRFVYQWIYSLRRKESRLPAGFWIISLIGSGEIIIYGIFRADPVLILGQTFGFAVYCRNLIIGYNDKV